MNFKVDKQFPNYDNVRVGINTADATWAIFSPIESPQS